MRRAVAVACLCLFLTSCTFSRTVETDEAGIRAHYQGLEETRFEVDVSAEFPDHVSEYTLEYVYHRDTDDTITVKSPESIAGVTVTIQDGETLLAVDGMELETGRLDEDGLSPISALPRLMRVWGTHPSGLETVRENGEDLLLLVYEEDQISYRTLFSRETYAPVRAEVFSGGECVLRLKYVT